jgi:tetratricopeptide (TPR) repeat protein
VPLDREATLKTAEKLLRQGKLDAAIAEYQKVIDDQPRDWNTANTLGDLLLRAGKTDKAVAQYARIADHLAKEGFFPKASAVYKKIIKIKPDDEHALMSAADISASQGLIAEAKMYFNTLAERRKARGDRNGAAEIRVKLGVLDPEDLEARVIGARANCELGETVAAATALRDLAQEFADKGDKNRAVDLLKESAALNPADPQARRMLVNAYLVSGQYDEVRQLASTAEEMKQLAAELQEQGQKDAALLLLADVLRHDPSDDETRSEVMRAYVAAGRVDDAVSLANSVPWLRELAAELMLRGHQDRALDVLAEASRQDPADEALRTDLARAFVRRGDLARAAEYLTREAAGEDPVLLMTYAEIELRRSNVDAALDALRTTLDRDAARRDDVVQLGWRFCDVNADAAFQCIELAASRAVEADDWEAAAAALDEFVTRVPNHVPALLKLVEVCVDGGLEATMYAAQAQLADAYLAAGLGSEACVIAEELVAREPWERANLDRFRRALILLGETDPDGVIAERLGGQQPFVSTDIRPASDSEDFAMPEPIGEPEPAASPAPVAMATRTVVSAKPAPPAEPAAPAEPESEAEPAQPEPAPAARVKPPARTGGTGRTFELGPNAIDWSAILGDAGETGTTSPPRAAPPRPQPQAPPSDSSPSARVPESAEVDLSEVLADLRPTVPASAGGGMDQKPKAPGDLEGVFQEFRDEVSKQSALDAAEQQFKLGHTYREMGMIDDAIAELQKAARSPRRRFEAASLVARMYKERGNVAQSIEWFERAAEAPAPTAEAGRSLLYDLGATLEANNETARALAVFLELQSDVDDYRDVRARVERLTKAQARG